RSSAHFRTISDPASRTYMEAFPDHRAVRLTELEWFLQTSDCFRPEVTGAPYDGCGAEALMYKLKTNSLMHSDAFRNKHSVVIFPIWGMPAWLNGGKGLQYPPSDYDLWRNVAREIAAFYGQFEGPDFYFEIWNEPDFEIFWMGNTDEYLEFYAETARAMKAANPSAQVGGPAVNQWYARIDADRDPLAFELIRKAAAEGLPLDFLSWHSYFSDPAFFKQAKDAYSQAVTYYRLPQMPRFVVSEWNMSGVQTRTSEWAPLIMAEGYLGITRAGIDIQTVYSWVDDHPLDYPDQTYYGLLTQEGTPRPVFYIHQFFDSLSRDSQGIAIVEAGGAKVLISKAAADGNRYKIMFWKPVTQGDWSAPKEYRITFADRGLVMVQGAYSVSDGLHTKQVSVSGNAISFSLAGNEVLGVEVSF
ncbi:MAG: hypothetical protein HYY14_00005, partial [Candidatus Omnitrophica bacterium]|nr:hypothetical protein [Candidatus Omnitrophota bacterium]